MCNITQKPHKTVKEITKKLHILGKNRILINCFQILDLVHKDCK